MQGEVASVNVSGIQTIEHRGNAVRTGIFKSPVVGRVAVAGVNLRGDDQADREVHGGPDRAAYAYAEEDYRWWHVELGRKLEPGKFGENLTLRGIDVSRALVGEVWRVGTTLFAVTSPRVPCYKLGIAMGDAAFIKVFARALRPGAYLSVVEEGDVGAGDPVEIVARPEHEMTMEDMARIYLFERHRAKELLVPELPMEWREWATAVGSNHAT